MNEGNYYFYDYENLHELLKKNETIKKIYYSKQYDEQKMGKELELIKFLENINNERLIECFKTNLFYYENLIHEKGFTFSDQLLIDSYIKKIYNFFDKELLKEQLSIFRNKYIFVDLQCMFVLLCLTSYSDDAIGKIIDIESLGLRDDNDNQNVFYRGESDFNYSLLPSIYRNYNFKKYPQVIRLNDLRAIYKDSNLLDKYKIIFGDEFEDIDYNFIAFMQHSKAYSPFLDLTKNHIIALSFATNTNNDCGKYFTTNSSIYKFKLEKNKIRNDKSEIEDFNIEIYKQRFSFNSLLKKTELYYSTYKLLNPKIYVFDEATNDRMKYQKGAFIFINQTIIINGIILLPMSYGSITKYKITPKEKLRIYEYITKEKRKYDYDHLMNPYKFFEECPLSK